MDNNWSLRKQVAWQAYEDACWRYNSWSDARWDALYRGDAESVARIDDTLAQWDEEKSRRLEYFNSIPE